MTMIGDPWADMIRLGLLAGFAIVIGAVAVVIVAYAVVWRRRVKAGDRRGLLPGHVVLIGLGVVGLATLQISRSVERIGGGVLVSWRLPVAAGSMLTLLSALILIVLHLARDRGRVSLSGGRR